MALTDTENSRITQIEEAVNALQTALNNVASKQEARAWSQIRQAEIDDLATRVAALEAAIKILQDA